MVVPQTNTEDDGGTELDNPWREDDEGTEEATDGGAEIETADVHSENVEVDDDETELKTGESTGDLSEAEIEDDETDDEDVDVETADVEADDLEDEFGFDKTDDATDDIDQEDSDDEPLGALEDLDEGGQIAADINAGVSSLGVIGIEDDDEQEDLREDFFKTARDFRLGYYGEQVAEEYVLTDDADEIDPVWGLVVATAIYGTIVVLRRPDTEEIKEKAQSQVGKIGQRGEA